MPAPPALPRQSPALNADPTVAGIIVQMPLPPAIPLRTVIDVLDPAKDIDGIHPAERGPARARLRGVPAGHGARRGGDPQAVRDPARGPPRRRRRSLERRGQAGRAPAPARARHGDDLPFAHGRPRAARPRGGDRDRRRGPARPDHRRHAPARARWWSTSASTCARAASSATWTRRRPPRSCRRSRRCPGGVGTADERDPAHPPDAGRAEPGRGPGWPSGRGRCAPTQSAEAAP